MGPDLELKRAFTDLQSKMIDTKQKMRLADMKIESQKRLITHSNLTEGEINSLPSGTKFYESIGRMFMLSTQHDIKEKLQEQKCTSEENIRALESNKKYLERNLRESENNLRELVFQKKCA